MELILTLNEGRGKVETRGERCFRAWGPLSQGGLGLFRLRGERVGGGKSPETAWSPLNAALSQPT